MKHLSNILLGTLFAAALMLLYCAHMELKYNFEAFTWQTKGQADQFNSMIATSYQRTHQAAQKITELEVQIKTLTTLNGQTNNFARTNPF
jgi:hypothetical protein